MRNIRYIKDSIESLSFARHKITFITGPRQSGKTTFARYLINRRKSGNYYNWDQTEFRRLWTKSPEQIIPKERSKTTPIIVLDEIHKARYWKRTLKGIYDTLESPVDLLVTGSARLDFYQKGSDSLLGRYVPFRLHPFSVREMQTREPNTPEDFISTTLPPQNKAFRKHLKLLMRFGGFPEPLFAQNEKVARIWRQNRVTQLIREDLRDISRLLELSQIEMLVSLMPERAASQLSRESLREDMEVSHNTITRWLKYLEALYYHFEIKPYSTKITRSIKKEGKLYLWDYSEIKDEGARFENLVAAHLLKACHFWTDSGEGAFELRYLRNKDGEEIDFLIIKDKRPWLAVEAKLNDATPSTAWRRFLPQLQLKRGYQLVSSDLPPRVNKIGDLEIVVANAGEFFGGMV